VRHHQLGEGARFEVESAADGELQAVADDRDGDERRRIVAAGLFDDAVARLVPDELAAERRAGEEVAGALRQGAAGLALLLGAAPLFASFAAEGDPALRGL